MVVGLSSVLWLSSSIEECLYKENVGVLGEMMLNFFFKNPRFCLGHNLAITYLN